MKKSFFSFLLLFMAVLFVGNANANDVPGTNVLNIEQVIQNNTLELDVVEITSNQEIKLNEGYPASFEHIKLISSGDKDHQVFNIKLRQIKHFPYRHKVPRSTRFRL